MTKLIPLTQGQSAIVDDEDFDSLIQFPWYAINLKHTFYAVRRERSKIISMHRHLLQVTQRNIIVDHIDRNGLNNSKLNLRTCTHAENIRNRKLTKGRKGFKGVYWNKADKKWIARIEKNYKSTYLGSFDCQEAAARAYDKKALLLFGEFAATNEMLGAFTK